MFFKFSSTKINSHTRPQGGFTLVEMIVAVAIFATVVLVAVGALLSIIDANRKANALRVVMENLNFAMESIARDVRTGDTYSCSGLGDCSGGDSLSFKDQDDLPVSYTLSNHVLLRVAGGESIAVTSPSVYVEDVSFSVTGSSSGDGIQPRVLMTIVGYAGSFGKNRSSFSLQTTISQRDTDS
ncbi:MAG: prepilin-type N-terminal cleavage/methylation domain-containing protein [Candidatus Yonathbacteria bacterium]|nr:prepilin-type N-terminal cleavage/methylation domain-containing protein [Candidatus Yonathbacteria bacterium]NTW47454.1 prepilin-type N-terminal cleavage/methylation domain-containing protein [Candidatus Yonathbacteria bacterium]